MQRLSYPTETVLSNKITRNRIVTSIKDSPRKPLGRRGSEGRLHSGEKKFITSFLGIEMEERGRRTTGNESQQM